VCQGAAFLFASAPTSQAGCRCNTQYVYVHMLPARPSPPASRRVNLGGVGATIDPSAAATTHKCDFGHSYPPPLRPQRRLEGGDHSNPKRRAAFHCLDGLCPCRHALHPIEIS
jgi:hypothetical protein